MSEHAANADMTQYYAARAREYERIYDKPERQADLRRLKAMLPPLFAGKRVLDVACGTGYWTQWFAPLAQQVVAVDVNRETLEVAAEKNWPEDSVEFRIADAYALPDDLGEFGAAFAGFWWSHIPARERPRFYASLHRRLRAGAVVVLLDNLYVEGSSTPVTRRDAEGNTYQLRRLANGSEHEVLKNFPTEAILAADISKCARNTCNARYTTLDYYWVFSYEFAG